MRIFGLVRFAVLSIVAAVTLLAAPQIERVPIDGAYVLAFNHDSFLPLFDLSAVVDRVPQDEVATAPIAHPDRSSFAKINRMALAPNDAWSVRAGNGVWRHAISSYG